jgi:predicted HicB family RNase H-like nuclease
MDEKKTRDPIPEFETLDDIAEFWDKHSTADYEDLTHEVKFDVRLRKRDKQIQNVTLLPELSETLRALADARGVSLETLVNVWLTEKVLELS